MTNAEIARLSFWKNLKNRLEYLGNPFTIQESDKQWAVVNRTDTNFWKKGYFIDYLHQKGIIRMGLYIPNDIELYNRLYKKKEVINNNLIFRTVIWLDKGPKSNNIRWIKREIAIINYSKEDAINEVIKTMKNIVDVLNPYLPKN